MARLGTLLANHWQLLGLTLAVFLFWRAAPVFPLRILVIFLHELSHGIAALLTGGAILDITFSAGEGGQALIRGGNRFVTLSAGYLGSLAIGAALLAVALRSHADRAAMALFGLTLLAVAALYVRDPFPLAFCLLAGAAMLAAARWLGRAVNDLALRVIGLTSLVYVPYDIFDDTIARPWAPSDARMLADEFGGTATLWGGLWLVLSLGVIALCLRYGIGARSNIALRVAVRARP